MSDFSRVHLFIYVTCLLQSVELEVTSGDSETEDGESLLDEFGVLGCCDEVILILDLLLIILKLREEKDRCGVFRLFGMLEVLLDPVEILNQQTL